MDNAETCHPKVTQARTPGLSVVKQLDFGQGELQKLREKSVVPDARLFVSTGCYLIANSLPVTHSENLRHCMLGCAGEEGKSNGDEAKKKAVTLTVVVML